MEKRAQWSEMNLEKIQGYLNEMAEDQIVVVLDELRADGRKGVQRLVHHYEKQARKREEEHQRLRVLYEKERMLYSKGYQFIAGIDEVGRGPLAGPVVAACVILPLGLELKGLNDSKKVHPKRRAELAEIIKKKAVAWSVGRVEHQEIDRLNILQATKKAMIQGVEGLCPSPDYLLIDALRLPLPIPQEGIVEGDSRCAAIAAASIIAKTYRDTFMEMIDQLYPEYGFKDHKGYGTPRHLEALERYGPCPLHRRSFLNMDITKSI